MANLRLERVNVTGIRMPDAFEHIKCDLWMTAQPSFLSERRRCDGVVDDQQDKSVRFAARFHTMALSVRLLDDALNTIMPMSHEMRQITRM